MGKHRTIGGILSDVTERFRHALAQTASQRTICWGTLKEAQRLGCAVAATRPWAHAWIRRHMETLPLSQITVLDAGAGLSNPLLDWYRPRVRKAYLIDLLTETRAEGNTTILRADLEKDVPLPDACVDFVTSASSIEHLSESGQLHFMQEAQRLLSRGGIMAVTVSYIFGLDDQALSLLSSDPALVKIGCTVSTRLNLQKLLAAAPRLKCPGKPRWSRFPGNPAFGSTLRVLSCCRGHGLPVVPQRFVELSTHPQAMQ